MRDTDYAREMATFAIGDNRIERLYVKEEEQEEIRFFLVAGRQRWRTDPSTYPRNN